MKKKYLLYILLLGISLSACKNISDLNEDTVNPSEVPGDVLFTNAQKNLVDQVSSINVNMNIFKLWAQYFTETSYVTEANFNIINRTIADNSFRTYYRDVLKDFQAAKTFITNQKNVFEEDTIIKVNKLQIINLLEVYTYNELVDIFGDVPYSEALNDEDISPAYDDAATIYKDLISRVDEAIAKLNPDYGSFETGDLIYSGDVASWIGFAYSLKLKLGITLADYDEALSKTVVEAAAAGGATGGVFSSSLDDAKMVYMSSSPNTNPLYEDLILSGRHDFIATSTIINLMGNLHDPRIHLFYNNPIKFAFLYTDDAGNSKDTTITTNSRYIFYKDENGKDSIVWEQVPFTLEGELSGIVRHYLGAPYGKKSSWSRFSHMTTALEEPTFPGILLTYTEVQFYLAEAAARNFSVGGTAEDFYNEGIMSSFLEWGGSASDALAYIASDEVAYSNTATTWKEKIGTQSWLASYSRGLTGYTTFRRLDYPILVMPPLAVSDTYPTRFTYPVNEQTLNADNYTKAASAIGGDLLTTKIFWDKY